MQLRKVWRQSLCLLSYVFLLLLKWGNQRYALKHSLHLFQGTQLLASCEWGKAQTGFTLKRRKNNMTGRGKQRKSISAKDHPKWTSFFALMLEVKQSSWQHFLPENITLSVKVLLVQTHCPGPVVIVYELSREGDCFKWLYWGKRAEMPVTPAQVALLPSSSPGWCLGTSTNKSATLWVSAASHRSTFPLFALRAWQMVEAQEQQRLNLNSLQIYSSLQEGEIGPETTGVNPGEASDFTRAVWLPSVRADHTVSFSFSVCADYEGTLGICGSWPSGPYPALEST